jgi:ubiquitin carboxyl-terminal hydrolase L5
LLKLHFYRPVDIRASLNNLIITTFNAEKRKAMEKKTTDVKPPPAKRAKTTVSVKSRKVNKGKEKEQKTDKEEEEETYHFIGYVPAYGKVWELDGLKSGPLEVGELPEDSSSTTSSKDPNRGWMDVVRPALRMKMEKYGGSGNDGSNIRFSLLAIVDDLYQKASDELELLKREKIALERRMEVGWETSVRVRVTFIEK